MNPYFLPKTVFKILTALKAPNTRWKLSRAYPGIFFLPHMEPAEFKLFKELCNSKSVFLEYGSGGSTLYLLKMRKKIFSVESNPDFFHYMCTIKLVQESMGKNLEYKYVNLGPTDKWGKPINFEMVGNWVSYYARIWKKVDPVRDEIDIIFIDGRFRVCCCLYSILKVVEYNWMDTIIIIHDFWRRKKYHVLLEYLQEIKSASNLASFKVKENVDIDAIKEKLAQYSLIVA